MDKTKLANLYDIIRVEEDRSDVSFAAQGLTIQEANALARESTGDDYFYIFVPGQDLTFVLCLSGPHV